MHLSGLSLTLAMEVMHCAKAQLDTERHEHQYSRLELQVCVSVS